MSAHRLALAVSAALLSALTLSGESVTKAAVPQAAYVDSVASSAEALRRFRADLHEQPTALGSDYTSRKALVRRFVHAVEKGDTVAVTVVAVVPIASRPLQAALQNSLAYRRGAS